MPSLRLVTPADVKVTQTPTRIRPGSVDIMVEAKCAASGCRKRETSTQTVRLRDVPNAVQRHVDRLNRLGWRVDADGKLLCPRHSAVQPTTRDRRVKKRAS